MQASTTDAVFDAMLRREYRALRAHERESERELRAPCPRTEQEHARAFGSIQKERSSNHRIDRLHRQGLAVQCGESTSDFYRRVAERYNLENEEEARNYVAYMTQYG